jgi:4-hydroxy-2-oxoheptanedioate aldolase
MKQNPVKRALTAGEASVGTWLSAGDIFLTRLLARVGFPWLTVDIEHSPYDWSHAATLFGVIADAGCVPIARVPKGSHDNIKRVLDAGAMGIIVPMVNTVEEAKTAIAAAKYPPIGNRSIGGGLHMLNFDAEAGEYFDKANDEILVILQTESPEGVENADEIYSLPGIDAIFVGPHDLTFQMRGDDGQNPTDAELESMLQRVLHAGKKAGVPVGLHTPSPEAANKRIAEGWQLIGVGSDVKMLVENAQQWVVKVGLKDQTTDMARY